MVVPHRRRRYLGLLFVLSVVGGSLALANDPITDIPKGHGFPADEATLERYRVTEDVAAMRRHGWALWAAVNQPATSGGPVWETWESLGTVFPDPAAPEAQPRSGRPRFQRPRQHQPTGPGPEAAGQSLLSFVLFNPISVAHIRTHKLNRRQTLADFNTAFNNDPSTPITDRHIPPFVRDSVALKLVWEVVPQSGMQVIPVWDFQPVGSTNDPITWARSIAVDGVRTQVPPGETVTVQVPAPGGGTAPRVCRVVSFADFYSFPLDTEELRANAQSVLGRPVSLGDRAILLGMHVTTKEIADWVWATYWWHDQANSGPFAADRTADVTGVWRNYLMDVALDGTTPREYDGTANACMNPWLEARFEDGLASNCMTCHQRATHPPQNFLPVTRGMLPPDHVYFSDKTTTDFLWSVAYEAK